MTAETILSDLQARGVRVWVEADTLKLDTPVGVLTDEDKTKLAAHKDQLLQLLARPKLGSSARPMVVRGDALFLCPWDECCGVVIGRGELHQCQSCSTWFELLPPETPGVCVLGDPVTESQFVN